MKPILCAYINKHRHFNAAPIFEALRSQTIPLHILLIECSPDGPKAITNQTASLADEIITVDPEHDPGPSVRFLLTKERTEFDYIYFQVDDWLPGHRCVEWLLRHAESSEHWSTIGQEGRIVVGNKLLHGRVRGDLPKPCDVVITNELARTADLQAACEFRQELSEQCAGVSLWEDDMQLCMGIQRKRLAPSIAITPTEKAYTWRRQRLPAPNALCSRTDHAAGRNEFVQHARSIGWKSFASENQ